jgi:E3 ubiquitin-protein ligase Topors
MDWDGEVRSHPDEPVDSDYYTKPGSGSGAGHEDDANKERCVICLMALRDRTVVGVCGHEFCVSTYLFGAKRGHGLPHLRFL